MGFLKLSFNNLWRRKVRTILTILGIAAAVSFVIGILSISEGFIVSLKQTAEKGGADLLVVSADQPFAFLGTVGGFDIPQEILPQLSAQENVKGAYPILARHIPPNASFMPTHIYGVTLEYFSELNPYLKLAAGRFFTSEEQTLLLTPDGIRQFKASLGEKVIIEDREFEVVGILEESGELAPTVGYTSLTALQQAYDAQGKLSFIALKLKDPGKANEIAEKIDQEWGKIVRATTLKEAISQALDLLRIAQAMDFSFSFVAVVISSLFILTTMIMAVSERTREIGTLRAIGIPRGLIFRLILYESLLLGLLGGLLGILGGLGLAQGIELIVGKALGLGQFLQTAVTVKLYILGLALSLFIGTIGGIYPAWRISRINIVQALRYE